ncbi:MAG: hypothetical protein WCY41_02630 [Candidatus Micrarchaeia archaeon]
MFLFQLSKNVADSKTTTLTDLETRLISLKMDAKSLIEFSKDVQAFAAANKDDKSKAFCCAAATWLTEKGAKDVGLKSLLDLYDANKTNAQFASNLVHYQNYFAVLDASRSEGGQLLLPAVPLAKLTNVLDIAVQNAAAAQQTESTVENERYYFVFANRKQADEFANSILKSLPAKFDSKVGTTSEIFGSEFVERKGISGNSYTVEFTCEYTGELPEQKAAAPSIKSGFTGTSKTTRLTSKITGESHSFSDNDISSYPQGAMSLAGNGKGIAQISGNAELWYGQKYRVDPKKDAEIGKRLTVSAFQGLTIKYGSELQEPIENFLAKPEGQNFIGKLNANSPQVNGSASIEVFYDGKNYSSLANAIKENWKLAGERAGLVYNYIKDLNASLAGKNLSTINISESDIKPSLYFFQDLPPEVMGRLMADKSLPTDLRDWLKANKASLHGKEHMDAVLSYLEKNPKDDVRNAHTKLSDALGKNDYALMNKYWLRYSPGNKEGLRVEDRGNQSLLVEAIENSGDGSSRSASISTSLPASISVGMDELEKNRIEVKKGEGASIEIGIVAVPSIIGIGARINAYVVDSEGKVAPLAFNNKTGKWSASGLKPGEYSVVAYAQSDDGKITTSLVGQKFTVEELVAPAKVKVITSTRKAVEQRINNMPTSFQPVGVSVDLSIPGMPASSIDVQGSPVLVSALKPLYNSLSADKNNPVVDSNGFFHPDRMAKSLTGGQAVEFFTGLRNATTEWLDASGVKEFILSNLTDQSNYGAFVKAIQSSNFIEARGYLNSDQNSDCRAELYQAFDGLANATRHSTKFNAADLYQLSKYSWSVSGGMQIDLGKTKEIVTVQEANEAETKELLQAELSTLGVSAKEQKKAAKLKAKNDQVYVKGDDGTYAIVKGGEGQYSVFSVPAIPSALYLYLQNDGYMLITGEKANVLSAGATLVGRIDVGGLDKFNIQPYLNINEQYQTTRGVQDKSWLVAAGNNSSFWTNANAGAVAEYCFNRFISAIVSGGIGMAVGEFNPSYTGSLRAGTKVTPIKGLEVSVLLDRNLAPNRASVDQVQGTVSYHDGQLGAYVGAGVGTKKNIAGAYPFSIKAGFGVDLQ